MVYETRELNKTAAKASIAALKFIFTNAVHYRVIKANFNNELQQLGLPKEHAQVICNTYEEFFPRIHKHQMKKMLSIGNLGEVRLSRGDTDGVKNIHLQTNWEVTGKGVQEKSDHNLMIRNSDLKVLINELQIARKLMKRYDVHGKK